MQGTGFSIIYEPSTRINTANRETEERIRNRNVIERQVTPGNLETYPNELRGYIVRSFPTLFPKTLLSKIFCCYATAVCSKVNTSK